MRTSTLAEFRRCEERPSSALRAPSPRAAGRRNAWCLLRVAANATHLVFTIAAKGMLLRRAPLIRPSGTFSPRCGEEECMVFAPCCGECNASRLCDCGDKECRALFDGAKGMLLRRASLIRPSATFSPRCGEKECMHLHDAERNAWCFLRADVNGNSEVACSALSRACLSISFSPHRGEKVAEGRMRGALAGRSHRTGSTAILLFL